MWDAIIPKSRAKANLVARQRIVALAFLPLITIALASCQNVITGPPTKIAAAIDSVKQVYCPDSRLAVFDVEMKVRGKNISILGEIDNPKALKALRYATKNATNDYKVELDITLLPDKTVGNEKYGLITSSVANLRSKDSDTSELVNQVLLGTAIEILKVSDGWHYVRVGDGYLGWMYKKFFIKGNSHFLSRWQDTKRIVFHELSGNAFKKPNRRSMIISDLVGGCILRKIKHQGMWTKVALPDGRTGFVSSNATVAYEEWTKPANVHPSKIVDTAYRLHGAPYLWGGNSTKAMDCSGFTQTVFKWNGFKLLRDASQQYRQGKPVPFGNNFDNLQPGDLLFFGPEKNRITHVGIYIGDKKFIHSDGRVRINSLDVGSPQFSEYRFRTLRAAKRILE